MKHPFVLLLATMAASGAERPPDIVFMLADDLGITDIGANTRDSTDAMTEEPFFETPHPDRPAADIERRDVSTPRPGVTHPTFPNPSFLIPT